MASAGGARRATSCCCETCKPFTDGGQVQCSVSVATSGTVDDAVFHANRLCLTASPSTVYRPSSPRRPCSLPKGSCTLAVFSVDPSPCGEVRGNIRSSQTRGTYEGDLREGPRRRGGAESGRPVGRGRWDHVRWHGTWRHHSAGGRPLTSQDALRQIST